MQDLFLKPLSTKVEKQHFLELKELEIRQWQLLIDKDIIEGGAKGDAEAFFNYDKDREEIAPFLQTEDREIEALNLKVIQKRDFLIRANMGFVYTRAKKFYGYFLTLEDRVQHGVLGLIKAINRFDVDRGYKFITYASMWVDNAIRRSLHSTETVIRIPVHAQGKHKIITRSIDAMVSNDDGVSEYAYSDLPSVAEDDHLLLDWDKAKKAFEGLSERNQFIIRNRIYTDEPLTLKEVGDLLGVSRERIRQLQNDSLDVLQAKLKVS